jgi:hypothetical protein
MTSFYYNDVAFQIKIYHISDIVNVSKTTQLFFKYL